MGAHRLFQCIGDRMDDEDLFLVRADDIVVEGCAAHDISSSTLDVGGFIHDRGRVSGSSADRPFPALQSLAHNTNPAGHGEQVHIFVLS